MASCKFALVLLCAVFAAQAVPAKEEARSSGNAIQTENNLLDGAYTDCLKKDSVACLKYKIFSFVDKMIGHRDVIAVTDDVKIIKTASDKDGAPRALIGNESFGNLFVNRVQRFLESYKIQVDIKGSDIVDVVSSTARSLSDSYDSYYGEDESVGVEEGRGKKKGKKGKEILGALLAAGAMKVALMCKLAIAGIALVAGKALIIGKIALALASILGLKKLLAHQQRHVTYEVVGHPHHSSSHVGSHETVVADVGHGGDWGHSGHGGGWGHSGHSGWGRSFDAQPLAYKAQIPAAAKQ